MDKNTYPFTLPPLPYGYDALEPYIDAETMYYHHDKHFKTYIDNLNQALEPYPELQNLTLEELLTSSLPILAEKAILNNGGGVYNHNFFFNGLAPKARGKHSPDGVLLEKINWKFGSFESFQSLFSERAAAVFGSGWTCLALTQRGTVEIFNLKDQQTVLSIGAKPLVMLDVWEHAYYLKYKNQRKEYINQIWNVINYPTLVTMRDAL